MEQEPPAEPRLVLASASSRRARILQSLGVPFRVVAPFVDETLRPGETAVAAAERLARAKAEAVAAAETLPVLAADTLVVCDGAILGKPGSEHDGAAMLRRLSGRRHDVLTGVCLISGSTGRSAVERTSVEFAPLTEGEIAWYLETEEPLDKAGAYHVDGRGALFITGIFGSPSNVAGLPVRLVRRLFQEAGLSLGLI